MKEKQPSSGRKQGLFLVHSPESTLQHGADLSGFISLVPALRYWAIYKGAQGIMGQEYLIYTYYKTSLFSLLLVISPFTQANLHIYMPLQLLVPCLYFESLSNWYTYLYYNNYMYKNWGKKNSPHSSLIDASFGRITSLDPPPFTLLFG